MICLPKNLLRWKLTISRDGVRILQALSPIKIRYQNKDNNHKKTLHRNSIFFPRVTFWNNKFFQKKIFLAHLLCWCLRHMTNLLGEQALTFHWLAHIEDPTTGTANPCWASQESGKKSHPSGVQVPGKRLQKKWDYERWVDISEAKGTVSVKAKG